MENQNAEMEVVSVSSPSVPAILDGKKYFKIIHREKNNPDKVKASCLMCSSENRNTIISGSLKATTNFKTHMKRLHRKVVDEFEKYKEDHKVSGARRKRRSDANIANLENLPTSVGKQLKLVDFNINTQKLSKQQKFNQNITNYVVHSMKPLSTVENESFKKIFQDLDPTLEIMSRRTLGRKIDDTYDFITQKLKEIFQTTNYISTTADIWSTKHRSFMGVTAHWIDQHKLERQSGVLACRRFKGTHSYERVAELLFDIHSAYGLSHDKLVSTITDNGSNFVKAFKEFGLESTKRLDAEEDCIGDENDAGDEEEDGTIQFQDVFANHSPCMDSFESSVIIETSIVLPNHLKCASHTLSLIATTDFNNVIKTSPMARLHHPAFAKCSALWNMSRRPKTAEIIFNMLGYSLNYPCPTRWNSLYDSVSQLMKFKDKLNELHKELNLNVFKQMEIEYLEEFCIVMKPLATALDCLQAETMCFYGQLLPTLFSLKSRMQSLQEKNLRHAAFIVTGLLNALEKRFNNYFQLLPEINEAILASCFHPNFKMRWLPECLEPERKRLQNLCVNSVEQLIAVADEEDPSSENEEDFYIFSSPPSQKQESQVELEIISFLNDKNKSLTGLNSYPTVKKMFIRFNTSLCSSAPVERLFSFAGFIHSPTRGRLSDNLFEKLVFLKGNDKFKRDNDF